MMTELFLIAHKVRNEPAFDIATRLDCPECIAQGCAECDQLGYWWVVPTSGHRAYPSDYAPISGFYSNMGERILDVLALPTPDLPDHYHLEASTTASRQSLADRLGLTARKAQPTAPFTRRL